MALSDFTFAIHSHTVLVFQIGIRDPVLEASVLCPVTPNPGKHHSCCLWDSHPGSQVGMQSGSICCFVSGLFHVACYLQGSSVVVAIFFSFHIPTPILTPSFPPAPTSPILSPNHSLERTRLLQGLQQRLTYQVEAGPGPSSLHQG